MTEPADYFSTRMPLDPRRAGVWREVVRHLSRYFGPGKTVLELGAGYCDCINAVPAARRIALDTWEGVRGHAAPGVEAIVGSCEAIPGVADASVDVVVASNLFEHLEEAELDRTLARVRAVLRPGGALVVIQPNYRLAPDRYFDDPTHKLVFSDDTLTARLLAAGFAIDRVEPRFLPLTLRSRVPARPILVRLYLLSPIRPLAGQMLVVARRPPAEPV